MKKVGIVLLASIGLFLASCGGGVASKANDLAQKTCSCIKDAGDLEKMIISMGRSTGFDRDKAAECMQEDAKEYLVYFKDLSDADKKEFIREYVKSLMDTDCADALLDKGVSMIKDEQIEKMIKEMD